MRWERSEYFKKITEKKNLGHKKGAVNPLEERGKQAS
jgi:hypothetical protein